MVSNQSPYANQEQNSALNNVSRLPVLTHGPGYDLGDVQQSFIQTGTNAFYRERGVSVGGQDRLRRVSCSRWDR